MLCTAGKKFAQCGKYVSLKFRYKLNTRGIEVVQKYDKADIWGLESDITSFKTLTLN